MGLKNAVKSGRCRQVGSDKGRSKGRVGSGSGNVRGQLWPSPRGTNDVYK